ncbi:alpha-crystallin B chain-like [Eucyclogobius newberryi]|uniref:alpha-crystallin B chain-like n=1 Tax=Eucyclogobius newberryi TaxID=166745 RepID=UPI003B5B6BB3
MPHSTGSLHCTNFTRIMDIPIQYRRAFPAQLSDLFLGESLSDWPHMWPLSWSFPWMRPSLLRWFNWPEIGHSEIHLEKNRFVIYLDVKHFSPDELSVEVSEDYITVRGKHENRQDDNAFTAKEFLRKFRLPAGVSSADITSSLSSDGVLTITAPRSAIGPERNIPISFDEKKLKN